MVTTDRSATAPPVRRALSKVPEVTAVFWIAKVLTTAMGESTSDYLVRNYDPVLAVLASAVVLAAVLVLQFAARRYLAYVYWLAVVMVSVFGTMAADVLHIRFGVPYAVSTGFFGVVLAAVLLVWNALEGTLSIHSIFTARREAFYWLTVLTTFALGTAVGDLTATTLGLGYLASGFLFAGLIAVPAVGYWKFGMNEVFAFWFAYILTRPLGASFADWMAVSQARGGLNLGTGQVSLALAGLIAVSVTYLAVTRKDIMGDQTGPAPTAAPESGARRAS